VARLPQSFLDELVSRVDIVELIDARVPLKKKGRDYMACCPFHGEKTPSFSVSPSKQFYHCFGCGAHGTALGFLMEYDRLEFLDAVRTLADMVGMPMPDTGGKPEGPSLAPLYAQLEEAAALFKRQLKEAPRAVEYLKKRGVSGEVAAAFGLGYAPDAWDTAVEALGHDDAARANLVTTGLCIKRDDGTGLYDRFRDRVMFPIRDARGRVIGFGGRVLDQDEPKYLNSPETPLFHKGRELYGLYEARQALRQVDRLLVVEGYMDVVRLAQAGIQYAVATLGTATTPEHLNRLFRVTNEVVFCFDGDRAGRQAAWRALENSLGHARDGRQLRFLFLPEGHDPDSLVGEEGREAFEARFADALPLSEFLVGQLAGQTDLSSVDGRARLAELARPLVQRVPEGIYRELLLDRLAEEVRMPAGRLLGLLGMDGSAPAAAQRPSRPRALAPAAGRKPLLTQAIMLVLHHPAAAAKVAREVDSLRQLTTRGIDVLVELIDAAAAEPKLTTAQLVERWRDRPEGARIAELAASESLVRDRAAAERELGTAVHKLVTEAGPARRLDELIAASGERKLTPEEQLEFQSLLGSLQRTEPASR